MRWLPILGLLAACGRGDQPGRPNFIEPDGRVTDAEIIPADWNDAPPVEGGPLQETAVVAVDGFIYVLGGFAGLEITDAVRVYGTESQTWSEGPRLPAPVHHATATVHDGTIYVLGMLETGGFAVSGATWAWTPGIDATWRVRASMPAGTERGAAVAGTVGSKIVVAGGFRGAAVVSALLYDPVADEWAVGPDLPDPRDHACGGSLDGILYVVGGRRIDTSDVKRSVFKFDGVEWLQPLPMPTARGGAGCGFVGRELIVVGGEGNPEAASGVFSETEALDVDNFTWRTLTPMPHPRHGMGATGWGDSLYVPGGADVAGFGAVDTFEVLVP